MPPGLFITLEGPDGSGKSTQIGSLREWLEERGHQVRTYEEPGGTRISNAVRQVLLEPEHSEMAARAELLLFLASRAQLVEQEIRPALLKGATVICDRFTDSTLAYQGIATGLPLEQLVELNAFATDGLSPDVTVLLDVDVEVGLRRQGKWNRIEALGVDYHKRVREAYRQVAERFKDRIVTVDASLPREAVQDRIRSAVDRLQVHR